MRESLVVISGIVLTASHNPKSTMDMSLLERWGAIGPPHDKAVIEKVRVTGFNDIRWDANESLIETRRYSSR